MSATFEAITRAATSRRQPVCAPVRLRATITIDIEAEDFLTAEQAKSTVAAQYDALRRSYPGAELEFRQRKPRTAPRAGLPGLVVDPYLDD
jgi:hypothetical protein